MTRSADHPDSGGHPFGDEDDLEGALGTGQDRYGPGTEVAPYGRLCTSDPCHGDPETEVVERTTP